MSDEPIRIAMWSGPRNISTALMRSWESRGDTAVWDEPLYAHYLQETGLDHPGAGEIIEHDETELRRVVERLGGDVPAGMPIFYQKHMAHHLLSGMARDWICIFRNALLIRDPREMITSLMKILPRPTLQDTGLPQQVELFDFLQSRTGRTPPVIDSRDVLEDPPRILALLCDALGVSYTDRMLSWAPGPRATDGVWAPHWYGQVERSTGFQPYRPKPDEVPTELSGVHERCRDLYDRLYERRIF